MQVSRWLKDSISRNVFGLLPLYYGLVLWKGLSQGVTVIIMTKLQGSNPGRGKSFFFLFLQNILTNSGAHPASYSMGTLESNCSPHLVSHLRINGTIPQLLVSMFSWHVQRKIYV